MQILFDYIKHMFNIIKMELKTLSLCGKDIDNVKFFNIIERLLSKKFIEQIVLDDNKIGKIPKNINLLKLNYISLNNNQINKVDDHFKSTNLKFLYLINNNFTEISSGITNCCNLLYLTLDFNNIT